ncbi:MAG: hypothetical protein HN691_16110 [Bacteroidetes bacterium]|nr:hypothetical protein [Bacteroidota bacterium]
MMWTCTKCGQKFIYKNANHSCRDKSVENYLHGKSGHTIGLFFHFLEEFNKIGEIVLHPAKTRISFAAQIRFGYIHRLGKDYIDVVFQFRQNYLDENQFYKIAQVPESSIFNHYVRIKQKEDVNEDLRNYMRIAYDIGLRKHLD